jgi:PAS domain S-box-containing protein
LARLFEELYDPALLIDPRGGAILGANKAALELLGYSAAELSALTPSDIHPHEIPRLEAFVRAVCENGRWISSDLSCRTKRGTKVPAEMRATLVEIGGRRCILVVVRDRRIDQLAELGRSIRKLTHDLRNTLATAQLLSDRLIGHPDQAVSRSAESITRSVERAVKICRQTLRIGRAVEPPPRRERFLLSDVLDEIVAAIGPAEVSGAAIRDESLSPVPLDADFDQVYRILLNLIRNAVNAGACGIVVSGKSLPAEAVIDVADDGPGLPEATRAQLFEEKAASATSDGTGLGLMIAAELARNHGGNLRLVETGSAGTLFRITLPTGFSPPT